MFHIATIVSLMSRKARPVTVCEVLGELKLTANHGPELNAWFQRNCSHFRQIGVNKFSYGLASWAGYICVFGSSQKQIYATSSYNAKVQAEAHFRAPANRKHLISVHLCEKPDGTPVNHIPVE